MSGKIQVIGAGLAGCEAAWQIAQAGVPVALLEMKPARYSPAHHYAGFAELVCSNSLKADRLESAAGLLKAEMRRMGSLLLGCADECRVPAGGALAVDREEFSDRVTQRIRSHPHITVVEKEAVDLPEGLAVIATGPLTSDALAEKIEALCGGSLSFFDAAAPIITAESLQKDRCFAASRYGRGDAEDYLNCPMDRGEYEVFYDALIAAERAPVHEFDKRSPKVYEGCMPIEVLAQRGKDTMRFGPLKPVGLTDPRTGRRPWAVVQLRRENREGTLLNLVGFQTNLKFAEQQRVFRLIPALQKAEFVRFGVMHRNTFLDSPRVLCDDFSHNIRRDLFFAGQITGVEGYNRYTYIGDPGGKKPLAADAGEGTVPSAPRNHDGSFKPSCVAEYERGFPAHGRKLRHIAGFARPDPGQKRRYAALARRALDALDRYMENQPLARE